MTNQGGIGQQEQNVQTGGYEFELEDVDGNTHQYHVGKKHEPAPRSNGPSGLRMLNYVAKVAGKPISEFLETNAGELMDMYTKARRSGQKEDVDTLREALESEAFQDDDGENFQLQLSKAFDRLVDAVDELETADNDGFAGVLMKVLYFTSRDGQPLNEKQSFNNAYRGNYMECMRAAYEVCVYNGFFGSLGGLIDVSGTDQ